MRDLNAELKVPRLCKCECGWELPTLGAIELLRSVHLVQFETTALMLFSLGFASEACRKRHAAMPVVTLTLQLIPGGRES